MEGLGVRQLQFGVGQRFSGGHLVIWSGIGVCVDTIGLSLAPGFQSSSVCVCVCVVIRNVQHRNEMLRQVPVLTT